MGFLETLKKATGVGLNAAEQYQRAFEKGVFLGPKSYGDAVTLFLAAAKKAAEVGDTQIEPYARANAALYRFVSAPKLDSLPPLGDALRPVPEIEAVGTRNETMPTAPIIEEIEARLVEAQIDDLAPTDHASRAAAHEQAAAAFKPLFSVDLFTYRYLKPADAHGATGQGRFFYHQGLAAFETALGLARRDPAGAADQMARSLASFQQCGDDAWITRASSRRDQYRKKRTCWSCQREFQGEGVHFSALPATVHPHALATVTALGQDVSTIDAQTGTVVLCTTCASLVSHLADQSAIARTEALRKEVGKHLVQMSTSLQALHAEVGALKSRMSLMTLRR